MASGQGPGKTCSISSSTISIIEEPCWGTDWLEGIVSKHGKFTGFVSMGVHLE